MAEGPARSKWLSPKWIGVGLGAVAIAAAAGWALTSGNSLFGSGSTVVDAVDTSLLPVSFGGKCGYVDSSGKMVINPQFDNALAFDSRLDEAPVLVGNKWGLIDREGKYVVNPQFDTISMSPFRNTLIVTMAGKQGTIDGSGKFVINPQFDSLSTIDVDGNAVAKVGEKYGVVDPAGNFLISPQFDDIVADWGDFRTSSFRILKEPLLILQQGKFGFADRSGKVTIQPQFADAEPFGSSGYAPAAIEEIDNEAFVRTRDQNAEAVVQLIRERLSSLILGDIRRNGLSVSFDLNNLMMGDQVRNWLDQNIRQGRWRVSSNTSRDPQGFITSASISLEQILEPTKRRRYGYIDKSGKFVIPPQFDGARRFSEAGLAPVTVGNVTGFIDPKGKIVINPQWPQAEPFKRVGGSWLAVVGISEPGSEKVRYGAIDSKGAYRINPQFDALGNFSEAGFAVAQSGELAGVVDAEGHYVLQPVYATLLPIPGTSTFIFIKGIAGDKDMQEIGIVDSTGKTLTTVRGGTCGGIYSFG